LVPDHGHEQGNGDTTDLATKDPEESWIKKNVILVSVLSVVFGVLVFGGASVGVCKRKAIKKACCAGADEGEQTKSTVVLKYDTEANKLQSTLTVLREAKAGQMIVCIVDERTHNLEICYRKDSEATKACFAQFIRQLFYFRKIKPFQMCNYNGALIVNVVHYDYCKLNWSIESHHPISKFNFETALTNNVCTPDMIEAKMARIEATYLLAQSKLLIDQPDAGLGFICFSTPPCSIDYKRDEAVIWKIQKRLNEKYDFIRFKWGNESGGDTVVPCLVLDRPLLKTVDLGDKDCGKASNLVTLPPDEAFVKAELAYWQGIKAQLAPSA
jgi:hypothetical protein